MPILLNLWPIAVMAMDWLAVIRSRRRLEYIAKPAAMLALLAWLWIDSRGGVGNAPLLWFALGLVCSLAGDVLLLLPERFFLPGLVAFLLAHLAYIYGLNAGGIMWLTETLLAIPMAIIGGWLVWRIGGALRAKGRGKLLAPIVLYAVIISLMVVSALATLFRSDWPVGPAALVSAGAVLFFLSDVVLAWNRFLAPLPHGRVVVIVAYHLGQLALILGAARMVEALPWIVYGYAALAFSLK